LFEILDKRILGQGIAEFKVRSPYIAKKRKAGNFVIIRINETGERIPLTIVDSDPQEGSITLIVQAIGKTTHQMHKLEKGDYILDVVGPLGHPTPIEKYGTAVCIGGGVGTAEVYPIAKALKEVDNYIIGIIGARSKDLIILEDEMAKICDELYITTDDGSKGLKGFVSHQLLNLIKEGRKIDIVYAIGPIIMMKVVAETTKPYKIKTYVSLNPIMIDGTGMCGGCRVSIDGKTKFACVDGPEFDAHLVNFDELIARNRTYLEFEQIAKERLLQ